jgi:hypothetical protein
VQEIQAAANRRDIPAGEWFDVDHPDKGDWPIFYPTPPF